MGYLYQRKGSKRWWLGYVDASGREVQLSSGTTSKSRAKALLDRLEREAWDQKHKVKAAGGGHQTVEELRDRWLTEAKDKRSFGNDVRHWNVLIDELGPGTRLVDLDPDRLSRLRGQLQTRTKTRGGKPWAAGTVNRHMGTLRAALNLAEREGWIATNPARHIRMLSEPEARDRIATPEEVESILDHAGEGSPLWICTLIGVETGMSLEEIVKLHRDSVDLDARLITTTRAKTQRTRRVPIPDRTMSALRTWSWQPDGRLLDLLPVTISGYWRRAVKRLGIKDLRFHDLRHTYATTKRREGHDLITVMRAMGHSQMSTAARYQTVDHDDLLGLLRPAKPGETKETTAEDADLLAKIRALIESGQK